MFLQELEQPTLKTAGIHISTGTSTLHSHKGELVYKQNVPVLQSNSSGAHAIASDPQHFKRTKHIDIAHFFLQDKIASQWLTIAPVQSSENLADILTKPLAAPMLSHLCQMFGLLTLEVHTGSIGGIKNDNPI
ncbi:hypothetical protein NDA11_006753 [Ustilago hordei]|uniref:Copia protein n=1 Tax=Ustilago hordei TaxID=120017 RepID=I2FZ16_USTHO|nr:uncharacterized protein UHO2_06763 [Ustilago hordei]KAJ1036904.1 hypothetical protein NDA10_006137 [Ustilago hordei]KAJ1576907.1 hypothetical protein NDA15_002930 [Ustilago hordei]KAJ1578587.1 hypothetical protein NDA12_002566 [Ustilago hordei]KAJ1584216.1 hypothetical protein NDA11_006753 [Ustilago hordei]KAJ1599142.1 hypothetical protein NDA14_002690 [Ustilago hordei]